MTTRDPYEWNARRAMDRPGRSGYEPTQDSDRAHARSAWEFGATAPDDQHEMVSRTSSTAPKRHNAGHARPLTP
jgi:hypothetical protein